MRCAVLIAVMLLAGCASAAREVAKEATPPGIDQTVQTLAEPDNRRLLASIANEPPLGEAFNRFGEHIGHGIAEQGAVEVAAALSRESAALADSGVIAKTNTTLKWVAWTATAVAGLIALTLLSLIAATFLTLAKIRHAHARADSLDRQLLTLAAAQGMRRGLSESNESARQSTLSR